MKKILLFLTLSLLPCYFILGSIKEIHSAYNTTVSRSTSPYQYIIFNKVDQEQSASNYTWNPHNIKTITQESIEDFRSKMPESQESDIKVGLQLIIPYFNITHNESVALIKKITQLSQTNKVPILIRLDGFSDWNQRDDLWKWWEPGISPQEAERRKNNVEWTDWSSDSAIGISWRNWAWQIRVPPQPNLCSKDYKKAKEEELSTLLPLIKSWYDSLPKNQKYLLAGVVLDTEVSIGTNYYYYPDDAYSPTIDPKYAPVNGGVDNSDAAKFTITSKSLKYDDRTDWDPNFNLNSPIEKITKGPSYGRQQLGYAAISACSIKNSGTIAIDDLDQTVKNHNVFLAEIGRRYFAPDKVFVHGMWNFSSNLATGFKSSNAVTNTVAPGFTIYGNQALRFPGIQDIEDALEVNQKIKYWGVAEYSILPTTGKASGDTETWLNSMSKILKTEGSKLITVYSWRDVATYESRGQGIFAAVESLVNGDPNKKTSQKKDSSDDIFMFNDQITTTECRVNDKGDIVPTISLGWDYYGEAYSYDIYKTEVGPVNDKPIPPIKTSDTIYYDFEVTPGKTYFYQVKPFTGQTGNTPTVNTTLSAISCDQTSKVAGCTKPYQKVTIDSSGKTICIDIPCQERNSSTCIADSKCELSKQEKSCQVKASADGSTFIATFGMGIESATSSLCQKDLNDAGIYLDDHQALCKQKALDQTSGCLNSVDVNDLTGCIQRVAQQTINELTPGAGQVVIAQNNPIGNLPADAAQPEQSQRIPTHVYLQVPDGEVELPINGGSISLPINNNQTVVRVKILFDKPDSSGSNEQFRTFTVLQKSEQQTAGCNPEGDIVPPGNPDSWTSEGMDCSSSDPSQRGQKWTCKGITKFAYGENCPPVQKSYDEQIKSDNTKSQCGLCKYSQIDNVDGEDQTRCYNGVPEDPNQDYDFNKNCVWAPECGTDPVPCP